MFYVEGRDSSGRRWVEAKSQTKSGATRRANKLNVKPGAALDEVYTVMNVDEYESYWGQMVERVNLMSGKPYMERRDTPTYCSPAYESYWSM